MIFMGSLSSLAMSSLKTSHLDSLQCAKRHEFKIDLEDDMPPVHRPLYKMSPLELGRGKETN